MAQGYKPQPKDGFEKLVKRIAELERRLDALTTAASNRNASISDGGDLTVRDTNGNQVVLAGHDSSGNRGFALTSPPTGGHPTGVDMLDFAVTPAGLTTLQLVDPSGLAAFAIDSLGNGSGIRWPWIQTSFAPMITSLWPGNTSASFVTVAQLGSNAFSQKFWADCRVICDGGATAGQVRMLINNVQVGSTGTVGTTASEVQFGPATMPAGTNTQDYTFIELQARVTAGAGTCRIQCYQAEWLNG